MRTHWRVLTVVLLAIVVVAVVIFRWPRLEDGMYSVRTTPPQAGQSAFEVRMTEPFEVRLERHVHEAAEQSEEEPASMGISVYAVNEHVSPQRIGPFASSKDWLRGEHVVQFNLHHQTELSVEFNGQHYPVDLHDEAFAGNLTVNHYTFNRRTGNGNGISIAAAESDEPLEFILMLYAFAR